MTLPRWAHYAVAATILSAVYFSRLAEIRMHNNESAWIGTSYYLEAFLGDDVSAARPDLPADVWSEGFWTLTQPPLALYVIGLGRRLGGFTVRDLNEPWIHGSGRNARDVPAQTPSRGLLLWSRRATTFVSVVTGLLFFFIAARCAGLVAAYVFILLYITNPFLLETLRRAMGDPVVTVFGVAAIALAIRGVDTVSRGADGGARAASHRASRGPLLGRAAWWAAAAGASCGLAGASKLNGLSGAAGVAAVAAITAASVPRPRPDAAHPTTSAGAFAPRVRWLAGLAAAALVLAAAAIAFIAPSPYLRRQPLHGFRKMIEHRVEATARQRELNAEYPVNGTLGGVKATVYQVVFKHPPLRFPAGWVVAVTLMLAGAVALVRDAYGGVRARAPNAALALLAVGASLSLPSIFSPLDWSRYYLFPILLASVCLAVGAAATLRRLARFRLAHARLTRARREG